MNISEFVSLVTLIALIWNSLRWVANKIYIWWITPRIVWHFFDCPNENENHYSIIVEQSSQQDELEINIIVEPKEGYGLQPGDCEIQVMIFDRTIGEECLTELRSEPVRGEFDISSSYQLKPNTRYRIIVKVSAGQVGSRPCDGYVFHIKAPNAKITNKKDRLNIEGEAVHRYYR